MANAFLATADLRRGRTSAARGFVSTCARTEDGRRSTRTDVRKAYASGTPRRSIETLRLSAWTERTRCARLRRHDSTGLAQERPEAEEQPMSIVALALDNYRRR